MGSMGLLETSASVFANRAPRHSVERASFGLGSSWARHRNR